VKKDDFFLFFYTGWVYNIVIDWLKNKKGVDNMNERLNGLELDENVETVFKVEPPLTPAKSEFGYIGVLLRDIYEDKLQCHICGKWFSSLSSHIVQSHDMSAADYRAEFSLPPKFPLISRELSGKHSKRASSPKNLERLKKNMAKMNKARKRKGGNNCKRYFATEAHANKHGLCPKQIESRYLIVADTVGREPTQCDLKKHDYALLAGIRKRFGTINKFRKAKGFKVKLRGKILTDQQIIAALRKFYCKYNRFPKKKDFVGKTPSYHTIRERFGSWNRALEMAGFNAREA